MFKRFRKACILLMSLCLLVGVTVFLVACGEDKKNVPPAAVDVSTIKYDGTLFTWSAPEGASSYKVVVNEKSSTEPAPKKAYSCTKFKDDGVFEIKITAVNEYGESAEVNKTFTQLPTMDEKTLVFDEDGVMTWAAVDNAESYLVSVNKTETKTEAREFDEFEYGVKNEIKIRPLGSDDTYFSLWSNAVSKTYLGAPTDIKYDGEYISWKNNSSASSYTVYINGSEEMTVTTYTTLYDSHRRDFSVKVRANGDGTKVFPSKDSEEVEYIFLDLVTNMHVEDGKVVWNAVDKADEYEVQIGNLTKRVSETSYELTAGSSQTVKIKPISTAKDSHYFSDWNEPETFFVLEKPKLRWNTQGGASGNVNASLNWNTVDGAENFNVRIVTPDGETSETTVSGVTPAYEDTYGQVGTYTISVQSVARSGSGRYDSAFTSPVTIIRLAAPTDGGDENFVVSDEYDLNKGFTVNFQPAAFADGYQLWKDGTAVTTASSGASSIRVTQVSYTSSDAEQVLHYSIQSIGDPNPKQIGDTFTVKLSSLTESNLVVDVTVQAKPQDDKVTFSGTKVQWERTSATRYAVDLGKTDSVLVPEYDLSTLNAGTVYHFRVCAQGDGHEKLPSPYTAEKNIRRLDAPKDIRVSTEGEGGTLTWGTVTDAQSYNIYYDGASQPVQSDGQANIMSYFENKGTTTVSIEAVANVTIGSEYVLSSKPSDVVQFMQLDDVGYGTPAFTDTQLRWNRPANAGTGTITYEIYQDGYALATRVSGTSYDISNLEPGTHNFKVRPIGNGTTLINGRSPSDVEGRDIETVTITKLAAPIVKTEGKYYTWTRNPQATNYEVIIGSHTYTQPQTDDGVDITFDPSPYLTLRGSHKVSVRALGDGGYNYISSKANSFQQQVELLNTPEFTLTYGSQTVIPNGELTITLAHAVPYATSYTYTVAGNDTTVNQLSYVYSTISRPTGAYSVTVVAKGNVFGDAVVAGERDNQIGTYYLDSPVPTPKSITLLSAPNTSNVKLGQGNILSWVMVDGAPTGYELKIYFSTDINNPVSAKTNYGELSCQVTNVPDGARIERVELRALGNGQDKITSEWVTWTNRQ